MGLVFGPHPTIPNWSIAMPTTTAREHVDADRYAFDFDHCHYSEGWAQIDTDQDAWYYGQWCNPGLLKTVAYCEGDVTVTTCETAEEFAAELRRIVQWHVDNGGWCRVDAMCEPDIIARFDALGLGDVLH
jgi:hypothetical protein